jgi:hypothetical protein
MPLLTLMILPVKRRHSQNVAKRPLWAKRLSCGGGLICACVLRDSCDQNLIKEKVLTSFHPETL